MKLIRYTRDFLASMFVFMAGFLSILPFLLPGILGCLMVYAGNEKLFEWIRRKHEPIFDKIMHIGDLIQGCETY